MKIAHIHSYTYSTFISKSNLFFVHDKFENIIIILGGKGENKLLKKENEFYYVPSKRNLNKIIEICKNVDVVVLYNLDRAKSYIANRLQLNVKIIWRFFGMELYGKMPEYVYSDLSIKLIKKEQKKKNKGKNIWNKRIRTVLSKIKWRTDFNNEIKKAISRIDFFLGLSKTEYIFLKEYWSDLPTFMQIPFSTIKTKELENKVKSNNIIIGNNRSPYNNIIDILELIEKCENKDKYSFNMMFNYGSNNIYTNEVREKALKIKNIKVIENFIPFDEYQKFYMSIDALVLNGYRQMAMRAIFESLSSGVKVYLNKKNVILQWLKEEGFLIFSIEDFSNDMKTENLGLLKTQAKHNAIQFENFRKKYNVEDFQEEIMELVD